MRLPTKTILLLSAILLTYCSDKEPTSFDETETTNDIIQKAEASSETVSSEIASSTEASSDSKSSTEASSTVTSSESKSSDTHSSAETSSEVASSEVTSSETSSSLASSSTPVSSSVAPSSSSVALTCDNAAAYTDGCPSDWEPSGFGACNATHTVKHNGALWKPNRHLGKPVIAPNDSTKNSEESWGTNDWIKQSDC